MDFCSNCGATTDPDWVFCRACGGGLDAPENGIASQPPEPIDPPSPKVELISRGWDVIEIDEEPSPGDPLADDEIGVPLPPGAVEVVVDDISVVATPPPDTAPTDDRPPEAMPQPSGTQSEAADGWDHLRPHGEVPPLLRRSKAPSRIAQLVLLLFSLAAVGAASVHFYANTQIDAYGNGTAVAATVRDVQRASDISLVVVAGLAVVALGALLWWFLVRDKTANLRLRASGIVAIITLLAGGGLIAAFRAMGQNTVAEALTANTFIILGLGLLMVAGLAAVRTLGQPGHGTG